MCGCLSHTLNWVPGPQARQVPWLGIKPVTLRFSGWHSIHWATPARAIFYLFNLILIPRYVHWFQRGRDGGKEGGGERHQCVVTSHVPPTGDLACNPGMCPDWESNQWPFGSQAGTQSPEPHWKKKSCLGPQIKYFVTHNHKKIS